METRSLLPLFQFLNDFSEILISDDKYDIAEFSSARHPSSFHHYQIGVLVKGLTDTAIQLITFSSRMLHSQESQAQSLVAIRQMMEDAERQRNADKMRRVNMLVEYFDNLRGRSGEQGREPMGALNPDGTIDWSNAIYKGNLSDILSRQEVQEEVRREYFRRQQSRMIKPIPALPAQILKPPRAPKLLA